MAPFKAPPADRYSNLPFAVENCYAAGFSRAFVRGAKVGPETRGSGTCSTGIPTLVRRNNSERRVRTSGARETINNPNQERQNSTARNGNPLKLREMSSMDSRIA